MEWASASTTRQDVTQEREILMLKLPHLQATSHRMRHTPVQRWLNVGQEKARACERTRGKSWELTPAKKQQGRMKGGRRRKEGA